LISTKRAASKTASPNAPLLRQKPKKLDIATRNTIKSSKRTIIKRKIDTLRAKMKAVFAAKVNKLKQIKVTRLISAAAAQIKKITTRLNALRSNAIGKLRGAIRARVGEFGTGAARKAGRNRNQKAIVDGNVTGSNKKLDDAKRDNDLKKPELIKKTDAKNREAGNVPNRHQDRFDANNRRNDARDGGRKAGENAGQSSSDAKDANTNRETTDTALGKERPKITPLEGVIATKKSNAEAAVKNAGNIDAKRIADTGLLGGRRGDKTTADTNRVNANADRITNLGLENAANQAVTKATTGKTDAARDQQKALAPMKANADTAVTQNFDARRIQGEVKTWQQSEVGIAQGNRKALVDGVSAEAEAAGFPRSLEGAAQAVQARRDQKTAAGNAKDNAEGALNTAGQKARDSDGRKKALEGAEPGMREKRNTAKEGADTNKPTRPDGYDGKVNRRRNIENTDLPNARNKRQGADGGRTNADTDLRNKQTERGQKDMDSKAEDGRARLAEGEITKIGGRRTAEISFFGILTRNHGTIDDVKGGRRPARQGAEVNADRTRNMIDTKKLADRGVGQRDNPTQLGARNSAQQAKAAGNGRTAAADGARGSKGLDASQRAATGADVKRKAAGESNDTDIPNAKRVRGEIDAATGQRTNLHDNRKGAAERKGGAAEKGGLAAEGARKANEGAGDVAGKALDADGKKTTAETAAETARKAAAKKRENAGAANETARQVSSDRGGAETAAGRRRDDRGDADRGRTEAEGQRKQHETDEADAGGRKKGAEDGMTGAQKDHEAAQKRLRENTDAEVNTNKNNLSDTGAAKTLQEGAAATAGTNRKGAADSLEAVSAELATKRTEKGDASDAMGDAKTALKTATGARIASEGRLGGLQGDTPTRRRTADEAGAAADAARPVRDSGVDTKTTRKGAIDGTDLPNARADAGRAGRAREGAATALDTASKDRGKKAGEREGLETNISNREQKGGALDGGKRAAVDGLNAANDARGTVKGAIDGRQTGLSGPHGLKDKIDNIRGAKAAAAGIDVPSPPLKKSRGEAAGDGAAAAKKGRQAADGLGAAQDGAAGHKTKRDEAGGNLETDGGKLNRNRAEAGAAGGTKKDLSDGRNGAAKNKGDAADGGAEASNSARDAKNTADGADQNRTTTDTNLKDAKDAAAATGAEADAKRRTADDAKADADATAERLKNDMEAAAQRKGDSDDADAARKRGGEDAKANATAEGEAAGRRNKAEEGLAGAEAEHKNRMGEMEANADGAVDTNKQLLDDADAGRQTAGGDLDTIGGKRRAAEAELDGVLQRKPGKNAEMDAAMRRRNSADADLLTKKRTAKDSNDSLNRQTGSTKTEGAELDTLRGELDGARPTRDSGLDGKLQRKGDIDGDKLPAARNSREAAKNARRGASDELAENIRRRNEADAKRERAQKDIDESIADMDEKKGRRDNEDAKAERGEIKKKVIEGDAGPHRGRMNRFHNLLGILQGVQLQLGLTNTVTAVVAGDVGALQDLINGGQIEKPAEASGPGAGPTGPAASGPVEPTPLQPPTVPGDLLNKDEYTRGYMDGVKDGETDGKVDGVREAEKKITIESELTEKIKEIDQKLEKDTKQIEDEAKEVARDEFCRSLKIKSAVEGVPFKLEDNPECKEGADAAAMSLEYGYGEVEYGEAEEGGPLTEADVGQTGGGWRRAFTNIPFGEVTDGIVEQDGGAVEPSDDYDRGYKDGYDIAYKAAFDNAYRLKKAEELSKDKEAVLPPMPSGPAASGPAASGPAEYGSPAAALPSGPALLTEDAAKLPPPATSSYGEASYGEASYGEASYGEASQEGGAGSSTPLKRARQAYRKRPRARTFKQHQLLLSKIRERTIFAQD
jgi:hypothetical protein